MACKEFRYTYKGEIDMKFMKDALLYIWQLPQNIVGLLFLLFLHPCSLVEKRNGCDVYMSIRMSGGISLGRYVFMSPILSMNKVSIRHEADGHGTQSLYLGPLYLLVIGIPSLIWACIYRMTSKDYYWFYTERWADKLAGIDR